MSKLFDAIQLGFQEAISHDQEKLDLRSQLIEIPEPSINYKPKQIIQLKEKIK